MELVAIYRVQEKSKNAHTQDVTFLARQTFIEMRIEVNVVTALSQSRSMPQIRKGATGWQETDFRAIFVQYYPRIIRVLARLHGDRARAEELANDVFWRLYRHPGLQADNNLGGWLHRTAINLGIDALRASSRRRQHEQAAGRQPKMAEIAEAGLQLAGMTASEAHAFCQTVDWSSTMVVPVPRNSSTFEKVIVDGVEGTLIVETLPQPNRYSLVWVKSGVVYSLTGQGDSNQAVNLVSSLH